MNNKIGSLLVLLLSACVVHGDPLVDESGNIVNPYVSKNYGILNDNNVNFRTHPDLKSDVIEQLNAGAPVFILGYGNEPVDIGEHRNYWLNAKHKENMGWIYGEFISTVDGVTFVDVLSDTSRKNNPISVFKSISGKYFIALREEYNLRVRNLDSYRIRYLLFDGETDAYDPRSEEIEQFTPVNYNGEDLLQFGADGVRGYILALLRVRSEREIEVQYEEMPKAGEGPCYFKGEESIRLNSDGLLEGTVRFVRIK